MRLVFNLTIQVDDLHLFCNGIVIKKKKCLVVYMKDFIIIIYVIQWN